MLLPQPEILEDSKEFSWSSSERDDGLVSPLLNTMSVSSYVNLSVGDVSCPCSAVQLIIKWSSLHSGSDKFSKVYSQLSSNWSDTDNKIWLKPVKPMLEWAHMYINEISKEIVVTDEIWSVKRT